jgi:hypothetical protein
MGDFGFYFGIGWEHIISPDALDHILFIIALAAIYTAQEWKHVLILVTAFTIGHSLTLFLSVTDVVRFPDVWVEFLIPLTIVITAFSNFFHKSYNDKAVRLNYYFALFFGFIHGMGFANTIRFMLSEEQNLGTSLLAFNLGLEAGQIVVVAALMFLCWLFIDRFRLVRRWWVLTLSGFVLVYAMIMTIERIPN